MAKVFEIPKMSLGSDFIKRKREGCLLSLHGSLTIPDRGHQVCRGAYNTKHFKTSYLISIFLQNSSQHVLNKTPLLQHTKMLPQVKWCNPTSYF